MMEATARAPELSTQDTNEPTLAANPVAEPTDDTFGPVAVESAQASAENAETNPVEVIGEANPAEVIETPANTRGVVTAVEDITLLTTRTWETSSSQASVLLSVNGEQLPGFHHEHVKRLGKSSVSPGLRIEVRPRWGPNTESVLAIKCIIRDGDLPCAFAFFNISMSRLEEQIDIAQFPTSDVAAINQLVSAGIASFEGAVEAKHKDEKHRDLFEDIPANAPLSEYIAKGAESFACVSLIVKATNVTVIYPPAFWDRLSTFPQSLRDVAQNVRNHMTKSLRSNSVSIWSFVFPAATGWESRWNYFKTSDVRINPFIALTRQCRGGKIDDLSYDNVTLQGIDRDNTSGEAAFAFISRDERTVSLIAGAVDEAMWQMNQAIACGEKAHSACLFPFPGSE